MRRPLLAVLATVLFVAAVYFGVGSQLPDRWRVETVRTLPVAIERLQREVGDLHSWPDWCGMQVTLGATTEVVASGTPATADQALTWRGSRGEVVLRLTSFEPAQGLAYELSLRRPDGEGGPLGRGEIRWVESQPADVETLAADQPRALSRVTWTETGAFDSYPARWSGWFGAVQEHVRQNQEAGLGRLQHRFESGK